MQNLKITDKINVRICVDVEAINAKDLCAIGFSVADQSGNLLEQSEWWPPVYLEKMDPQCRSEFWEKNPVLFDHLKNNNKYPFKTNPRFHSERSEISKQIIDKWDGYEKNYNIVSIDADNPSFDLPLLDRFISPYSHRLPMRYTSNGCYRKITDYSGVISYWGLSESIRKGVSLIQPHTHFPMEDAYHTILKNILTERLLCKIQGMIGESLHETFQHEINNFSRPLWRKNI